MDIAKYSNYMQNVSEITSDLFDLAITIIDKNFVLVAGTHSYKDSVGKKVENPNVFRYVMEKDKCVLIKDPRKDLVCIECLNKDRCKKTTAIYASLKVENTVDSITNSINSKLSKGILKYPTGEEFQGNISGQWYCGIPISGKMIFSDGSIKNGNWLETYNLNHREYDNVLEISSPTKKLALAKELFNEKQFTNAINKARYALSTENYLTAKEWFVKALYIKPDESEYINSRIENIDKL